MTTVRSLHHFSNALRAQLAAPGSPAAPLPFGELALELFQLQFTANAAYRRLCDARGMHPHSVTEWMAIPPIPTRAFKEFELTCLQPSERTAVFHSSGTTGQKPSRHFHSAQSLALYEASLLSWFASCVLDRTRTSSHLEFLSLSPAPAEAPHSSLAHMFATVQGVFAPHPPRFACGLEADGAWRLHAGRALTALNHAADSAIPLVLLGTAFSFVHLADLLEAERVRFRLPAGSRIMETGGYKGRTRELPKEDLHKLITQRLGVPASHIICEYGMSELSSQAYDRVAESSAIDHRKLAIHPRVLHFPPWARAVVVSPETGAEVAEGETGLLRVFDLANVWSVMALQTEDLAIRRGRSFELLGRAQLAEPRGCSLMPA